MSAADTAIQFALGQVGKPYRWGATGPDAYDCSGLVQAAYRSAGISLGRTTYQQVTQGSRISSSSLLLPGDLVFPDPGHVQIYLGSNKVVEAPHTGAFVRVMNMWGFWTARRVAAPGTVSFGTQPTSFLSSVGGANPNIGQGNLADPKTGKKCYDVIMTGVGPVFVWNGNCPDSMKSEGPHSAPSLPGEDQLGQILSAIGAIGTALGWLTDPHNWLRLAEFVAGFAILIMAAIGSTHVQDLVKTTSKAAKTVGKVANASA